MTTEHPHGPGGMYDCPVCIVDTRLKNLERHAYELQGIIDEQTGIIAIMERQLSLQRAAIWAMLKQASMDEVSQDAAANPWIGIRHEFASKINPLVKLLNTKLGIKVEAPKEGAAASIVVATKF
jgi:hypothetical protein